MRIDMKMEKMSQKALERKSNKPIMEKKRRARINHCLNQLKALILEADNERSRHSKLEKADILEMTVKYLQTFRAYHLAQVQQLNQLQSAGHQQQVQLHKQLQQQQAAIVQRQQALAAGSAQSSPSPPMNLTSHHLQHHQLPLPLQLSLQAAMASVVTTDMLNQQAVASGEISPAGSNASSNNSSTSPTTTIAQNLFHQTGNQQHPHHHHQLSNQHHHNHHLQALNTNHLAHQQQHPSQMSPTWRPW